MEAAMKRILFAIVFLAAVFTGAYAHPPTEIIITFDTAKSMVYADIMHNTKNPKEHFIYMIQVSVNGKKLIKQEATEQVSPDKQSVAFLIPGLKDGDKVMIDADCNKYGDLQKEAVVKTGAEKKPVKSKK
jgi:hypothetical protein